MNDITKRVIDTLNRHDETISFLSRLEFASVMNGGLTSGSVIFAGAGGILSQDNANLFWDDANNRLTVPTIKPVSDTLTISNIGSGALTAIEIGSLATGDRYAFIDFHGDDTYTDYGLRLLRSNTGANAISSLQHRGTGELQLLNIEAAPIKFYTSNTLQMTLNSSGNLGIGTSSPGARLDVAGDIYITKGSSPYLGASDNFDLRLGVNTTEYMRITTGGLVGVGCTPACRLDVSGGTLRALDGSNVSPTGGKGLELLATGNIGYVISYNRGSSAWQDLALQANNVSFFTGGNLRWNVNSTGHLIPTGTGSLDIGSAVTYANEINYKTLTDRGCLAFIPEWETLDGSKVSNLDAIKNMKPHPTEKTVYGEVKLDYASVPKHSYKPAKIADEDVELDMYDSDGKKLKFKKGEQIGDNGVEMTSIFSIMLGAIRELSEKVEKLETKTK